MSQLQQAEMTSQQAAIGRLKAEVDTLTQEVARLGHTEHGAVDCQGSDSWKDGWFAASWNPNGGYHASRSVRVNFRKAYAVVPPVVQLSILGFYNAGDKHEEYAAVVEHVDVGGFTLSCMTYTHDVFFSVRDMDVSWISVARNDVS